MWKETVFDAKERHKGKSPLDPSAKRVTCPVLQSPYDLCWALPRPTWYQSCLVARTCGRWLAGWMTIFDKPSVTAAGGGDSFPSQRSQIATRAACKREVRSSFLHSIAAANTEALKTCQLSHGGDPCSDLPPPSLTSLRPFLFLHRARRVLFFSGKFRKERNGGASRSLPFANRLVFALCFV